MSSPTPTDAIAFLRSRPLASLVQQEIERRILSGDLAAGARLNELEIARTLGISRAPVRESLRTLEQAGLVVSRKNYGVFVRTVSLDQAREIYQVRAFIDAGVGAVLARDLGAEGLKDLEERIARMERAYAAGDASAYHALNVAFHERMVELAGNATLLQIYRRLLKELALYRSHSLGQPGAMRSSVAEHAAIFSSIRMRDVETAKKLMAEHIIASSARLQRAQRNKALAVARAHHERRSS